MKKLAVLMLIAVIVSGCVGNKKSGDSVAKLKSLTWVTTGGGDAEFGVEASGNNFLVKVTRWSFQEMKKEVTISSGEAYSLLQGIFNGEVDLGKLVKNKSGQLSGTWTSISLVNADGSKKEYEDLDIFGKPSLNAIYTAVQDKMQ